MLRLFFIDNTIGYLLVFFTAAIIPMFSFEPVVSIEVERQEQAERGKRMKDIRENELKMTKTELATKIGTSSQFLGLVEEGKGNLVYYSLRKFREVSGHSADYILFGLDDTCINKAKKLLKNYSEEELIQAIEIIEKLSLFIKKR